MDLKRLGQRAKDLVDKRGGSESVKEDAGELQEIAKGSGSLTDKAKAAAAAIKEPGKDEPATGATPADAPGAPAGERERAERKVEGEERGKHARGGHGRGGHGRGRRGRRQERGDAGGGGASA